MSEKEMNMPLSHLPSDRFNDYNLGEFGVPTMMTTADQGVKLISLANRFDKPSWARFMMLLRHTIIKDRRVFFVNGVPRTASINWIRDHVHEMKAYKHWEYDIKSYIDFMIENQAEEGFFYEITVVHDNAHAHMVDPPLVKPLDDNVTLVRIELEADVEYLVVEGATQIVKATGDDEWGKKVLPALEKAINYMTSSPKRWDKEHGLVKRPFTMDSWDFTYGQGGGDRRIYDDTPMSVMHGDNSGVYQAMNQIAWLNRRYGNEEKALDWEKRAKTLKENLDKYCWTGDYYMHQFHLNHNGAEDADETKILSLSNAYDMNRHIVTQEQADKIIAEYQRRKETFPAFAEWYCINPPYTKFKRNPQGEYWKVNEYVNGGIATFVAGELAKAAFTYGHEEYGWDILKRVRKISNEKQGIFFLYDPDTGDNMSGGPDGWCAAAILDAIDSGLAGIVDGDVCYNILKFSPRWAVTELEEARYITGYECSKSLVETRYWNTGDSVCYELLCPSKRVDCHILLPKGKAAKRVILDGEEIKFETSKINDSVYVDFSFEKEHLPVIRDKWSKLKVHSIKIEF